MYGWRVLNRGELTETRLSQSQLLSILTKTEPAVWLLFFVVLHLGGKLTRLRQESALQGSKVMEEQPPDYLPLKFFVLCKWLWAISYFLFFGNLLPIHLASKAKQFAYAGVSWTVYFCASLCAVFVMGSILKRGLSPLPGLSSAAWTVFRWAASLAFLLALTAHLPIFGVASVGGWLNELSVSFLLCICMFELSILALFLMQLRRLGMFLLSRPIGLSIGLAILGLLDLAIGVTANAPPRIAIAANLAQEIGIIFVVAMWSFYILRREPKRLPHSLSPASRLSKWDDIAKRIGVAHKDAEHVPFITTVESVVDSILERHKEKAS